MKRIVRWVLLAGVGGPGLLTLSCSGMLLTETRDAAVNGFSGGLSMTVEDVVAAFLADAFGLPSDSGTMPAP